MRPTTLLTFALLYGTTSAAPAAAAVRGLVEACGTRICPWFQPVLSAPSGWVADEASARANRLAVLVPAGRSFADAPARIYGRAFANADGLTVEARVRESQARWREASPGATVERLADVPRGGGQGAFQLYRYRNPARSAQPVELTAFGEDVDASGRRFGVLVVLTATSDAALTRAEKDYRRVLAEF